MLLDFEKWKTYVQTLPTHRVEVALLAENWLRDDVYGPEYLQFLEAEYDRRQSEHSAVNEVEEVA